MRKRWLLFGVLWGWLLVEGGSAATPTAPEDRFSPCALSALLAEAPCAQQPLQLPLSPIFLDRLNPMARGPFSASLLSRLPPPAPRPPGAPPAALLAQPPPLRLEALRLPRALGISELLQSVESPGPSPGSASGPQRGRPAELAIEVGRIATLEAKLDLLSTLVGLLLDQLASQGELPPLTEKGLTLVLNLDSPAFQAVLRSQGLFVFGDLGLEQITLTIRSGPFRSPTALDPSDLTLTEGQITVRFRLGFTEWTSATLFERQQGITKEVLTIRAAFGGLQLMGQAVFAPDYRQVGLRATLGDLVLHGTALLTADGLRQPSFGLEWRFPTPGSGP